MENFPNYSGYGQTPTVCANHPDRVSYARCGRCNRAICGECQMNQGAGTVCPDCYRELTGGSSKGSKARGSFLARHWHITYTLILINVAAYGLQQIIPNEWMINHGMMWWPYVQHGEYYRLISYGFLHMQHDPMHLVWNMINLFIYGVSLERMMGRWKFLVVYLGSIVFGALGVYVLAPGTSVVGASGGLFGLMGSFLAILIIRKQKDTARVFVMITAPNIIYSIMTPSNISHACHAGGFVGGVLLTLLFVPLVDKPEPPQQQSPQPWQNGRY
mgnify:FL=1